MRINYNIMRTKKNRERNILFKTTELSSDKQIKAYNYEVKKLINFFVKTAEGGGVNAPHPSE